MVCVGPGRALQTHANLAPFSGPTEQLYNASIMTSRPRRRFSFSHSINIHVLSAFSSVPGLLLGPGARKMKKPSSLTIPLSALKQHVLWHLFPFKTVLDVHFILLSESRANGFESSLVVQSLMGQRRIPLEREVLRTSNGALGHGAQVLQTPEERAFFFVHTLEKSGEKLCDQCCVGIAFSPQVLSEQMLWIWKVSPVSPT